MMKNKFQSFLSINNIQVQNGFGLVDVIVSMALLAGVITYGIYFSSLRLSTVYSSNITRSINKEIQRDIERIKSDLWSMYFLEDEGKYSLTRQECEDFTEGIMNLSSWVIDNNTDNRMIQSWRPGEKRSKVFTGQPVLITRELQLQTPFGLESFNKSIASIAYRVQWGKKNIHWVSIALTPEAHGWCKQVM
tara:strand:+ start:4232 stop:4804 length:573 start_codon:yes stop_codon:yes gene_type:complete